MVWKLFFNFLNGVGWDSNFFFAFLVTVQHPILKVMFSWGKKCPDPNTLNITLLLEQKANPLRTAPVGPHVCSLRPTVPWLSLLSKPPSPAFLLPGLLALAICSPRAYMAQVLCGWKLLLWALLPVTVAGSSGLSSSWLELKPRHTQNHLGPLGGVVKRGLESWEASLVDAWG